MKTIQIRTILCAFALLFTLAVSAENFSNPKSDPSACPAFSSKQKKQNHHKKNHKGNTASTKKGKTAQHCAAY
jgi:hypothetical protein